MKKKGSVIGIILGIVIIIVGIVMASGFHGAYSGTSPMGYEFGADYYTEQYSATKDVADNVRKLGNLVENAVEFSLKLIGFFMIAFGGVVICYFICKVAEENRLKESTEQIVINKKHAEPAKEEISEI